MLGAAMTAESSHHHLYLIDGSGYIFRAFFALPPMTRPDGTPVNAVYGFTNMLIKLLADTESDGVAVIFDTARKTFRTDIYPACRLVKDQKIRFCFYKDGIALTDIDKVKFNPCRAYYIWSNKAEKNYKNRLFIKLQRPFLA